MPLSFPLAHTRPPYNCRYASKPKPKTPSSKRVLNPCGPWNGTEMTDLSDRDYYEELLVAFIFNYTDFIIYLTLIIIPGMCPCEVVPISH